MDIVPIPTKSPNCNPHAERFVCLSKEECRNRMVLLGRNALERRRVQKYKRTLRPAAGPAPSSSIIVVESATIKGLATPLCFWIRRSPDFTPRLVRTAPRSNMSGLPAVRLRMAYRRFSSMHSQVTRFVVLVAIAAVAVGVVAWAQSPRGTSKATIGGSEVSVDYGRPSLRGRDMLGQAPVGTVWRTGADQSTTFTTGADITVSGTAIAKGRVQLVHETSERRHVAPSVQLPDRAVGHVPRRQPRRGRSPAHVEEGRRRDGTVHDSSCPAPATAARSS